MRDVKLIPHDFMGRLEKVSSKGAVCFKPVSDCLSINSQMFMNWTIAEMSGGEYFFPYDVSLVLQGAEVEVVTYGLTDLEEKYFRDRERKQGRSKPVFRQDLFVLSGEYEGLVQRNGPIYAFSLDRVLDEIDKQSEVRVSRFLGERYGSIFD